MLEEVLEVAINDNTFRSDDLEFTFAARVRIPIFLSPCPLDVTQFQIVLTLSQAWSDCASFGDFESYRDRFERIQAYFAPRLPEAVDVGNLMIKTILAKTAQQ